MHRTWCARVFLLIHLPPARTIASTDMEDEFDALADVKPNEIILDWNGSALGQATIAPST